MGLWMSCNKCIDLSKGDYLIFPGDDDIFSKDLLSEEIRILDKFPNVGFVSPEYHHIDTHGNILQTSRNLSINKDYKIFTGGEFLDYFLLNEPPRKNNIVWVWPSVMMRKNLVMKIGKFGSDVKTSRGDNWLLFRLAVLSDFCQICKPLFSFRVYFSDRSTIPFRRDDARKGTIFDETIWVVKETIKFAKENNLDLKEDFEKKTLKEISRSTVKFNGIITWVGAGFEGGYMRRARIIMKIFHKCVKFDPFILLSPKTYLVIAGSIIIPRSVIMSISKIYMNFFQKKVNKYR
jgi:intein/homing endonuclease